jgi:hypothetical protein
MTNKSDRQHGDRSIGQQLVDVAVSNKQVKRPFLANLNPDPDPTKRWKRPKIGCRTSHDGDQPPPGPTSFELFGRRIKG